MNNLNYRIKFTLLIFISICFLNCSDDGDGSNSSDNPRTVADVIEDFNNIEFKTGINDITLESNTDGTFWHFRVIVPEGASPTNKLPLVISLHGGATNANPDAHLSTACLVVPGFEELDAYIISPNSNGSVWYSQKNRIQVEALVDLASTSFYIDTEKVVVTGYSDGGNGSWFFAQFYSNLFSASIPMASAYNTANSSGDVNALNIPLYVIHGSEDNLFPIETTKGYVDASIAAGSDIQFVTAEGLGHYEPCEYVPYLKEAVTWLETEVWN